MLAEPDAAAGGQQNIPWFVSDVLPTDFTLLFSSLLSPSFFPADDATSDKAKSEKERGDLQRMVQRWESYVEKGVFRLSVPQGVPVGSAGCEGADCE